MEYMLLIYDSESDNKNRSDEAHKQIFGEYMTFTKDLQQSGKMKSGAPLEPSSAATTVRVRNGKTAVTDGPFAETKEQLGGYYLVEAKDLDEAISIAAKIPSSKFGSIEVRPVMKMNM
jgi:hypothetical protein